MERDDDAFGEFADRALDAARRRRRVVIPAAAAAMVAVVVGCVLVFGMPSGPREAPKRDAAADPTLGPQLPIELPDEADPLPDDGVGPALLTYAIACDEGDVSEFPPQCWRILTTDGRHWSMPDVATFTHEDPAALESPAVLSPSGDRVAYLRSNGSLVVRHLRSGEIVRVHTWRPRRIEFPRINWSADGHWLLATTDDGGDVWGSRPPTPDAVLVDTDTMKTTELQTYGRSFGVADSAAFPFGFETSLSARGITKVDALPLIDHSGNRVGSVSAKLLPGRLRHIGGVLGSISPDGRILAAMGTDYSAPEGDPYYGATALTFVDVVENRVAREHLYQERAGARRVHKILGWRDNSTLLMMAADRRANAWTVVGLAWRTGEMVELLRLADYVPMQLYVAQGLVGAGR